MTQVLRPDRAQSPGIESTQPATPAQKAALFAELISLARQHPSASGASLLIALAAGLAMIAGWTRDLDGDDFVGLILVVVIAVTAVTVVRLPRGVRGGLQLAAILAVVVCLIALTRRAWFSLAPEVHEANVPSSSSRPEMPAASTPLPPHGREPTELACAARQHRTGDSCEHDVPPQAVSAKDGPRAVCSGAPLKTCPEVACIRKKSGHPYIFACLCGQDTRRFGARGRDYVQAASVLLQTGDVPDCTRERGWNQ